MEKKNSDGHRTKTPRSHDLIHARLTQGLATACTSRLAESSGDISHDQSERIKKNGPLKSRGSTAIQFGQKWK